jgi:hypothetical protein
MYVKQSIGRHVAIAAQRIARRNPDLASTERRFLFVGDMLMRKMELCASFTNMLQTNA